MKSAGWEKYWGSIDSLDYWRIPAPEVLEFFEEMKLEQDKYLKMKPLI